MTDSLPDPTRARPGELTFAAPRRGKPPRHLADLDPSRAPDGGRGAGAQGVPGQAAVDALLRAARRVAGGDDRPAQGGPRRAGRGDLLPTLLTPVRPAHRRRRRRPCKSVWRLHDGALVESVLMRYPRRVTICVSSQAGCGMNCPFCATGQAGLTRNMSAARDRRAGRRTPPARCAAATRRRRGTTTAGPRCGSPTSSSWAWGRRWPTTRRRSARSAG